MAATEPDVPVPGDGEWHPISTPTDGNVAFGINDPDERFKPVFIASTGDTDTQPPAGTGGVPRFLGDEPTVMEGEYGWARCSHGSSLYKQPVA